MSIYNNIKSNEPIESEGKSFVQFPGPGIVENNTLETIELLEASNGNKYMKFSFKNIDTGAQLSRLEWELSEEGQEADKIAKKFNNQLKRLKHIVTKFYPKEIPSYKTFEGLVGTVTSFDDMATKIINLLNKVIIGETVRLKVVYNYKDQLSLPEYVPFIELMKVPKDKSKLTITNFDKTVKEGVTTDNPQDLTNTTSTVKVESDDLPF